MAVLTNRSQLYARIHCSGFKGIKPNEPNEDFAGSGFLVGSEYVLTCYHVIRDELSRPSSKIQILFPFLLNSAFFVDDFSLVYFNEDDDIAVFKLSKPLNFLVNEFEIVNDNCDEMDDTPCLVYYSRNQFDYGLTSAVIKEVIQNGIIQANQTDNGNPITRGYSGSPVFAKFENQEFILGMVRRANGFGVFNFTPGKSLISKIPDYSGKIVNKYNLPRLPDDYIRRNEDYDKAKRILIDDVTTELKILLVYGPSGVGKTNLTIDLATSFPYKRKGWVDCRLTSTEGDFLKIAGQLRHGDLLVIDDLTAEHPLMAGCWLKNQHQSIKCDIIISSANDGMAKLLQTQCDFSKRKKAKLGISGFTKEEALRYLQDVDESYLSENAKIRIGQATANIPILLQMIKQLILTKNQQVALLDESDFFSANEELVEELEQIENPDLMAEIVIDKLLTSTRISDTSKDVLFVLSKLSLMGGMEPIVLQKVLKYPKDEMDECLSFLKRKGFISLISNPFEQGNKVMKTKVIILHDLFREIIPKVCKLDIQPFSKNFLEFVNTQGLESSNTNLMAKIEGLLIKMKNLWIEQGAEHKTLDFVITLDKYTDELTSLMPQGSAFEAISQFIASRFEMLIMKECYIVIPVAATIARLPKKLILGEMIWQGTKNIYYEEYDNTLARACCIYCAFSHWREVEGIDKGFILKRAKLHLTEIYNLSDQKHSDLEFAAVLNGIFLMDDLEYVIDTIKSERYRNTFKTNFMTTLSLIVHLINIDKRKYPVDFKGRCRTFIKYLISEELKKVCESHAKEDVLTYMRLNNYTVNPSLVKCYSGCLNPIGMSRTIGLISFSEDFDRFIIPFRGKHTMV